MSSLVRIGLLALAGSLLGMPALAQDRPAKDSDEIGASFSLLADRDYLARCLERPEASEPLVVRGASPPRLLINLSPPERYWLAQRARRSAATTRSRCAP